MIRLKRRYAGFAALSLGLVAASVIAAEKTVMIGGAPMYPSKDIVDNAVNSKDHTTLVAAVQAAGLVDTLRSAGPFTVFAPTNAAFKKLPAGTVDTLVKPENKDSLTKILTYHVVAGRITARDIEARVKSGGGRATLVTIEGQPLEASLSHGKIVLTDEAGGQAHITIADAEQSNGVIHVIDTVLSPVERGPKTPPPDPPPPPKKR